MKIGGLIWLRDIVDKLAWKHQVDPEEVEEVLNNQPKIRFVEKGERKSEDVYMALGQTAAGRYLAVLFIYTAVCTCVFRFGSDFPQCLLAFLPEYLNIRVKTAVKRRKKH